MTPRLLVVVVALAAACGGGPSTVAPPAVEPVAAEPDAPTRPDGSPDFVARALALPDVQWDSLATPTATVYTQPGTHAGDHADSLAAEVEGAVRHALRRIDEPAFPHRLRVFFAGSRDEMGAILGQPVTGAAIAEQHAVFLVAAPDWRPLTKHEVFHAVSIGLWGHPLGPLSRETFFAGGWLREGTATAAEGRCASVPLHDVVAAMQREADLIPLDTLATAFYEQNDVDAYLQAGSLLDYVRQEHGLDAIRQLWDRGPEAFPEATGATAAEVEAAWHAWLAGIPVRDTPELDALRDEGCG